MSIRENIREAFKALMGGRPPASPWSMMNAGTGLRWVPPGSQLDYQREAGDLRRHAVLSIALDWLTRQFLSAPMVVGYEQESKEEQAIPNHPALQLLERANPFWPGRQTWAGILSDYLIYGNAYAAKVRGAGGLPTEIYWLPAKWMIVVASPAGVYPPVKEYRYRMGSMQVAYEPSDVIHFRDVPDPDNALLGLGKIQCQIRNAAAINAGERYTASVLRNGTVGKLLSPKVSVEEVLKGGGPDEAQMGMASRAIRNRLGGESAGSVTDVNIPVDLVDLGTGPEGMLIDRILDRPESMLLSALGLNSMALDLPSSAETRTYANKKEARREAWEHAVIPLQDAIADHLTNQLLIEFDPRLELWFERKNVAALREDANERMQRATQFYSNSLGTRNEAREIAGVEPLEEANPDGYLYYGTPTEDSKAATEEASQHQQDMNAEQQGLEDGQDEAATGESEATEGDNEGDAENE